MTPPDPLQSISTPPSSERHAPPSPSTALGPRRPVTVTQPEGREAWARANRCPPQSRVSRGQAAGLGLRDLGSRLRPAQGERAQGRGAWPPAAFPSRAGRWAEASLPAIPRQAPAPPPRGPSALGPGAPRCSGLAPPHPLLVAPKGQETGVACLSWARLPGGAAGA